MAGAERFGCGSPGAWLALLSSGLLAALAWAATARTVVPAAQSPDLLLVLLEDVGPADGPAMPALQKLAGHGRRFERAQHVSPEARAARLAIVTGLSPEASGVLQAGDELSDQAPSVAALLRRAGYATLRVGALEEERLDAPAAGWDGVLAAPEPAADLERSLAGLARHQPLFALARLRLTPASDRAGGGTPLPAPHAPERGWPTVPLISVLHHDHMLRPGQLFQPATEDDATLAARGRQEAARAAALDARLGQLLLLFERARGRPPGLVLVAGESSPYRGGHGGLPRTDVLHEETLRALLVAGGTAVAQPGQPTQALVEMSDVVPTLLELAAAPAPPGGGRSFAALLRDPQARGREEARAVVFRQAGELGRSVRSPRFRLNEWPDGSLELYDHSSDPGEHDNLVAGGTKAAAAPIVDDLRQHLAARLAALHGPGRPAGPRAPAGRRPPNVVLMLFDDLPARLGSFGAPVQTPNLDRLASRGRAFRQAYAAVAMCSPSRTSLLSGRWPERIDLWSNDQDQRARLQDALPLQEHFHAHGYFTARLGKVYQNDAEFAWDWTDSSLAQPEDEPVGRGRRRRAETPLDPAGWVDHWTRVTDNADQDEPDGLRARQAVRVLEEHRDRPFFLAIGFAKPHLRWTAPRPYFERYPPAGRTPPSVPPGDLEDVPAVAIANQPVDFPGQRAVWDPPFPDALVQRALAAHDASLTFVDAQAGLVLDALDRLKLWDDTIVVAFGDHGYQLGEHGLWRKDTLFEPALRTPLLVWAPGLKRPGTPSEALVELQDVYPTLVDLAGLPAPAGLEGLSLRPLLQDPGATLHEVVYGLRRTRVAPLARSLRTVRLRFTEWPDGSLELYDLERDPGELDNLASQPGQAELVSRLRARLQAARAPTDAP